MKALVQFMLVMVSSSALAGPFDKKPPVEIVPIPAPAPVVVAPVALPIAPAVPASIVNPATTPPKIAASAPAAVNSPLPINSSVPKSATAQVAPVAPVAPVNIQFKTAKTASVASPAANAAQPAVKKTAQVAQVTPVPSVFKRPIPFTPAEISTEANRQLKQDSPLTQEKSTAKTPDDRITAGNAECGDSFVGGFICREKVKLVACNSDWNDGTKPGATKCIQSTRTPANFN